MKRELAKQLGGTDGVARQHAKGRMTIRERIDGLLDEGSFQELGMGAGSAYRDENGEITEFLPANFVLGFGKVDGRDCVIGGEDFTLKGGSPNAAGLRKDLCGRCRPEVPHAPYTAARGRWRQCNRRRRRERRTGDGWLTGL